MNAYHITAVVQRYYERCKKYKLSSYKAKVSLTQEQARREAEVVKALKLCGIPVKLID